MDQESSQVTAARRPADMPWQRTADHSVWRAYRNGYSLTVTRFGLDEWRAAIQAVNGTERSPIVRRREAAQAWAENRAGGIS